MVNLYNDIHQKKTAFELAEAALATETTAMNAMERKYQLGMASQLDYLQEQAAFLGKQIRPPDSGDIPVPGDGDV